MAKASAFGGISRSLSNRNYRIYVCGSIASNLGFWIHQLGLNWLAWDLTNSAFWLGAVNFSALFPAVILTPVTGAIADKYGLKRVSTIALFCIGIAAVTLAILVFSGLITIGLLMVMVAIQGIIFSFDLPARQAMVPNLVDRADLSSAIALNTTSFHAAGFIGPALFPLVFALAGSGGAFLVNGISFLTFGFLMLTIRLGYSEGPKRPTRGLYGDTKEGMLYIAMHPGILAVFFVSAISHILVRPYQALLPAFSDTVFIQPEGALLAVGADRYGALQAIAGLGALVAGIYIASRGKTEGMTRSLIISGILSLIFLFLFAITDVLIVGLFLMAMVGFVQLSAGVYSQSLVQNAVDPAVRGRVTGVSTGMAIGFPAIGAIILGPLGDEFGIQAPVAAGAVLGLIIWIGVARRLSRQTEQLERPPSHD